MRHKRHFRHLILACGRPQVPRLCQVACPLQLVGRPGYLGSWKADGFAISTLALPWTGNGILRGCFQFLRSVRAVTPARLRDMEYIWKTNVRFLAAGREVHRHKPHRALYECVPSTCFSVLIHFAIRHLSAKCPTTYIVKLPTARL